MGAAMKIKAKRMRALLRHCATGADSSSRASEAVWQPTRAQETRLLWVDPEDLARSLAACSVQDGPGVGGASAPASAPAAPAATAPPAAAAAQPAAKCSPHAPRDPGDDPGPGEPAQHQPAQPAQGRHSVQADDADEELELAMADLHACCREQVGLPALCQAPITLHRCSHTTGLDDTRHTCVRAYARARLCTHIPAAAEDGNAQPPAPEWRQRRTRTRYVHAHT